MATCTKPHMLGLFKRISLDGAGAPTNIRPTSMLLVLYSALFRYHPEFTRFDSFAFSRRNKKAPSVDLLTGNPSSHAPALLQRKATARIAYALTESGAAADVSAFKFRPPADYSFGGIMGRI